MRIKMFAAALSMTLGTALSAQAADMKLSMATSWGGGPLMEIGAKAFADNVKVMSDGRIEIEVFPGGTLGNALKVSETVKNGVADMGHTWMGYDWGQDKTTILFGGYAGSFNTELMLHWLYRGGGVELQREYRQEEFGLISMPLFARTAEAFLHSRKKVETLDDLNGLKLRTAGAWLEISKGMGASPVTAPGAEVYTMLERGAIDATEWGTLWENIGPGFHRITKYVIIPGIHQPTAPFELVINEGVWERFSDDDKAMIERAARLTTLDSWLTVGQEDAKALAFFREQGNEIIELAPEVQFAAREAAQQWADDSAKGNDWFQRVLDHQRAFDELWADASRYRSVLRPDG